MALRLCSDKAAAGRFSGSSWNQGWSCSRTRAQLAGKGTQLGDNLVLAQTLSDLIVAGLQEISADIPEKVKMTNEVGSMGKDSLDRFADSFAHIVDHRQGSPKRPFICCRKGMIGSAFSEAIFTFSRTMPLRASKALSRIGPLPSQVPSICKR